MTIQIPLSQSGSSDQFAAALEAHRADLVAHCAGEPGVASPVGPALVEQLIQRVPQSGPVESRGPDDFVILPYEIVDDTSPPPTLEQRKQALITQVNHATHAAIGVVLSPAKAQLVAMDASDAALKPEETRTPADRAVIELYTEYQCQSLDISKAALRATVAIEELTESTIDGWKIPSF